MFSCLSTTTKLEKFSWRNINCRLLCHIEIIMVIMTNFLFLCYQAPRRETGGETRGTRRAPRARARTRFYPAVSGASRSSSVVVFIGRVSRTPRSPLAEFDTRIPVHTACVSGASTPASTRCPSNRISPGSARLEIDTRTRARVSAQDKNRKRARASRIKRYLYVYTVYGAAAADRGQLALRAAWRSAREQRVEL